MRSRLLPIAVLLVAASFILAVQDSPYRGEERRPIKSLSTGMIEDLRAGRGMGLAKAAELNSYPGPMHVLELKSELKLTSAQERRTQAAFESMRAKAQSVGKQIIEAEAKLDADFVLRTVDAKSLQTQVLKIGRLNGELRACHLAAHIEMAKILSKWQIGEYDRLRGYRRS